MTYENKAKKCNTAHSMPVDVKEADLTPRRETSYHTCVRGYNRQFSEGWLRKCVTATLKSPWDGAPGHSISGVCALISGLGYPGTWWEGLAVHSLLSGLVG